MPPPARRVHGLGLGSFKANSVVFCLLQVGSCLPLKALDCLIDIVALGDLGDIAGEKNASAHLDAVLYCCVDLSNVDGEEG